MLTGCAVYERDPVSDEYVCPDAADVSLRFRLSDWDAGTPPPAEIAWERIALPDDWTTAACSRCRIRFPLRRAVLDTIPDGVWVELFCTPDHARSN